MEARPFNSLRDGAVGQAFVQTAGIASSVGVGVGKDGAERLQHILTTRPVDDDEPGPDETWQILHLEI